MLACLVRGVTDFFLITPEGSWELRMGHGTCVGSIPMKYKFKVLNGMYSSLLFLRHLIKAAAI